MPQKPQITQAMIDLYDEYTHLTLDRRDFMQKLTKLAGSSAAAAAVAPMLAATSARAGLVLEDDPRLSTERVTFPAEPGEVAAYLVMPADRTGPLPGVVVIHENRGLNAHIEDVARRFALEGFVALAPDFLSSVGGTPDDEDQARELTTTLNPGAALKSGLAAISYLREHQASTGRVGIVGFCWGGGVVNQLAPSDPNLDAAVVFYGRAAQEAEIPRIEARMMMHYAGLDERINFGIEDFREALDAAGVDYTMHMYEGVNHAFHNDTSEARYDREAADLAWSRTIEFLKDALSDG